MILRRRERRSFALSYLFLCSWAAVSVAAQEGFDCHITLDSYKYDLTSLSGEHTVARTRNTPPSTMVDSVTFNLCTDLTTKDAAEGDQCPSGTRACLTKTNKKGSEADRIVAVVPVAQTATLNAEYSATSSPKGLSLTLHGGSYPSSTAPDSDTVAQSLKVSLICATDASEPKFSSYDGKELAIEWSAPAGCSFQGEAPPGSPADHGSEDNKKSESVGSGIGWFFLVLLLAVAAYFGLGAYYNYTTYGARGADLIPHRDFWKEVPYMLSDVVSHLCSTVRPRRPSSRSGYIAV